MKRIQTKIWALGLAAVFSLSALPVASQDIFPEGASPVIVAPAQQTVGYSERTLCYAIKANVPFEVASDAAWLTVRRGADGSVYLHLSQNLGGEPRTANVTFSNAENNLAEVLKVTQKQDESVEVIPDDKSIRPSSAKANNAHTGLGVERTYDGDVKTCWHTSYAGSDALKVSPQTPAILTYNFTGVEQIDYLKYTPRQDGNTNGNFKQVELWVKCEGEAEYTLFGSYDWKGSSSPTVLEFPEGLKKPVSIQFKVLTGSNDNAACAEMEFFKSVSMDSGDFSVFADDLYTTLKPGVTLEQIENMENAFAKSLALKLYEGSYDLNYRVAEFPCRLSYVTLSEIWNAPGKYYDQFDGVTGINFSKGQHAVIVEGIPADETVTLRIVAWYEGKDGSNFDGGNPQVFNYNLTNGINKIKYTFGYDGLGYIAYYTTGDPKEKPNIRIHFVNGQVNGYLSPDKTNEEMHELCANAKNICMDAVGSKVHSVWTSKGFHDYCKASDGKSLGYRQFMNMLDSLIEWEHYLLGFNKYDMVPNNHTFAYTNYTYYMFQGGLGVSFHHNQESRILNCNTLMYRDDDAIWGLSHEWGHQHQMHPYFCWAGMTEVTNNMNSYYNIMRMGYNSSEKIRQWPPARKHFVQGEMPGTNEDGGTTLTDDGKVISDKRQKAYGIAGRYSYSPDMMAVCQAMQDGVISKVSDNPARALHISEVSVGETLCPYIMLFNYATYTLGLKDFAPDMYEALRQTDKEGGSVIEKTGGVDKYELIAAAQNGNKNNSLSILKKEYPKSAWIERSYITTSHCSQNDNHVPYILNYIRKVSRLTGYNLFPYFEQWGFLRQIALYIGDYGDKPYIMTEAMYNEFKEDMDALVESGELKEMPEGMVKEISNMRDINTSTDFKFKTPAIPN